MTAQLQLRSQLAAVLAKHCPGLNDHRPEPCPKCAQILSEIGDCAAEFLLEASECFAGKAGQA